MSRSSGRGVRRSPLPGTMAHGCVACHGSMRSVGMPMTDEGRRGTLDDVGSTCREAAYLNSSDAADPLRGPLIFGVRRRWRFRSM